LSSASVNELSASSQPRISHALLLTAAQILRALLRFVFIIVIARSLGPSNFGIYALLLAMVEMIAVASGSGYTDYLTRETARDQYLGWALARQLIWLRLACIVPSIAIGIAILWLLGNTRSVLIAGALISCALIPRSVSEAVQGVVRGVGRYAAFLAIELATGLSLVAGASVLVLRGGGLGTAVFTEIFAALAASVLAFALAPELGTMRHTGLSLSRLLKTCSIFNLYYFVANLYDRLDVVLLSKLAGSAATGVYAAAYRAIGMVQLLPYGILYSLLPALSRADWEEERQLKSLERAMGLLLGAAFAIVLATMVFADAVIPRLLGSAYAESAAALKILIWAVVLRYINYGLNIKLLAAGKEFVFVVTSALSLAVNLLGNVLLIPRFSWRAAAFLTIVTEFVLLIQNIYWLRRSLGSVPIPLGWFRTSLAFVFTLFVLLVGSRLTSPLLLGTACLLLFILCLFRFGTFSQFTSIWAQSR
jgi:O-antigen/teichoic acid export membrane protein